MAWVIIIVIAKALKLEKYGFELKAYSLVYKNKSVNEILIKILERTKRSIKIFADLSVIAGFIMMGFAFYFLLNNVSNYFVAQSNFSELTVLIPGVTLTSAPAIAYFLLSIPIVLVMHEGAHGIVAALEKIKIKTGGFAIFIALFAGFVEPDEEEFEKAKKISKLRVIGAGATSNVLFAIVLGAIMLTNPLFGMVIESIPLFGDPILGTFYELSQGVLIISIIPALVEAPIKYLILKKIETAPRIYLLEKFLKESPSAAANESACLNFISGIFFSVSVILTHTLAIPTSFFILTEK